MKEKHMTSSHALKWAQTEYARDLQRLKETQESASQRVGVSMTPSQFMTDLLRKARHYCDLNGLDFGALDKSAHQKYLKDLS
jgi:hypothetical protein